MLMLRNNKFIFLCITLFLTSACGNNKYDLEFKRPSDCRAHIAQVICVVESKNKGKIWLDSDDRPCLDGAQKYTDMLQQLYDDFPEILQRMFCSLQRINIEKSSLPTAFARTLWIKDQETGELRTNGSILHLSQKPLDLNLNLAKWASWKEQLSFGGSQDSFNLSVDLPRAETKSPPKINDFLYFLIAHEFAHFFDAANGVNAQETCDKKQKSHCPFKKESWGALSFESNNMVKATADFPKRSKLCFYWCHGKYLPRTAIPALYDALEKSSFISTYASTNASEEFADSFAYFIMHEHLHSAFSFLLPNAPHYDVMAKLESPVFAIKLHYLKSLVSHLKYP